MILDFFGWYLLPATDKLLKPIAVEGKKNMLYIFLSFASAGYHVSTEASLGFVATSLGAGVLLSFVRRSD